MRRLQRLGAVGLLAAAATSATWSSVEAGAEQIGGRAEFDVSGSVCGPPPASYSDFTDFTDYPPIVMRGSLEGCWYTKVDVAKDNGAPSGVYLEQGREVFVGRLNGGPVGTFATVYRFESKWDPDVSTGREVVGRCQHPLVAGSGTGGFAGATGRVNFKDIVADGTYVWRGHISLP